MAVIRGRHVNIAQSRINANQDLESRGQLGEVVLQRGLEVLVDLVEEGDVHLLQVVSAAELRLSPGMDACMPPRLVHLVVDLVEDQRLVVVDRVLVDRVVHCARHMPAMS